MPSKAKVDTKKLNREQMELRGRTTDATIEHEAFHDTMRRIGDKYGPVKYKEIMNGLIGAHDQNALASVASFAESRKYKRNDPHFNEEVLTHARDILVNPTKRKDFENHLKNKFGYGEASIREVINKLKSGHQKAYEFSQNSKPDMFEQGQAGFGQIAADKNK